MEHEQTVWASELLGAFARRARWEALSNDAADFTAKMDKAFLFKELSFQIASAYFRSGYGRL